MYHGLQTINDVLMGIIGAGLHRYLEGHYKVMQDGIFLTFVPPSKFVYIFYQCLSKLLFSSLQPFSVADKFHWEEPQFITAIQDGGDGLML
jgi:hypothetical protein